MTNIPVTTREKVAWILYDFANSGYATIVLTTIYSAYFVATLASSNGYDTATATLFWTLAIALGNVLVLISAPLIGALADTHAIRKKLLVAVTFGCILFTALLAIPEPGDIISASLLIVLSYFMFATGENLIAAFLPELTTRENIGRLSGYGWSIGFLGGLSALVICFIYIDWAKTLGHTAADYVPITMIIVAVFFAVATIPTVLWLRERGIKTTNTDTSLKKSLHDIINTFKMLPQYTDLYRFLFALVSFQAGIFIIIVLAAIYASQVMGFDTQQNIYLVGIINITAAIGAFGFGHLQDKFGSIRILLLTLLIWCVAIITAWASHDITTFWIAANLIGIALGASQSASRALIGLFSPPGRYGEFFGLWGMCVKFAAIIGPLSYGMINWLTDGNHRHSILTTLVFFVIGILILLTVDEKRGRERALQT